MKLIEFHVPTVIDTLKALEEDTVPAFGKMTSRKMLSHLVDIARISNGKQQVDFANKVEHLPKLKHILNKQAPFPIGFSAPAQVEALIDAADENVSLEELIQQLENELTAFEGHFQSAEQTVVNAVFGPLTQEEWKLFHRKHMSHHLSQFGLWSYE